jgi:serine protease Do
MNRHGVIRIISAFFIGLILLNVNTFAQKNPAPRPARGSIQFGAKQHPVIDSSGDLNTFRKVFSKVAIKVTPCVVAVLPTKIDTVYRNPFEKFFDDESKSSSGSLFDWPDSSNNQTSNDKKQTQEKKTRKVQALGSGVIVSNIGYILTNYHVVSGASEIEVHLTDGRSFQAKTAGADSLCDVAVIKILGDVPKDLPVACFGNSDSLQPGDWVAAVGNPFNLISTVTAGIISALNRQIEPDSSMYQNFIQTDAAINPGNSGGALVNIYGEVVGINTLIYSKTGGFMGIGFAIPINMAKRVMEDLIYEGKVVRGWIGLSIQELDNTTRLAIDLQNTSGALVSDVYKGQPADRAGIKRGDIILSINNQKIIDPNDLRNIVALLHPGDQVPVAIIRNGKKIELTMPIVERTNQRIEDTSPKIAKSSTTPAPHGKIDDRSGLAVSDIDQSIKSQYNLSSDSKGIIVTDIDHSLSDARTTLSPGDVIMEAKAQGRANLEIRSVKNFDGFLKSLKKDQAVILLASRDGATFYVPFIIK